MVMRLESSHSPWWMKVKCPSCGPSLGGASRAPGITLVELNSIRYHEKLDRLVGLGKEAFITWTCRGGQWNVRLRAKLTTHT
jgi:hypothetical protein